MILARCGGLCRRGVPQGIIPETLKNCRNPETEKRREIAVFFFSNMQQKEIATTLLLTSRENNDEHGESVITFSIRYAFSLHRGNRKRKKKPSLPPPPKKKTQERREECVAILSTGSRRITKSRVQRYESVTRSSCFGLKTSAMRVTFLVRV